MKKLFGLFLAAVMLSLAGCSEGSPVPEGTTSGAQSGTSVVSSGQTAKKDQNLNPLTGEYNLKDRAVGKRPVSVMVNNIKKAWPQYGLGSADICYEIVVEGGITRIMAVFADYQSMPKIGSVRSVRHYYTDCSYPLNTLFVHWGGSDPGYDALKDRGIDNIDGMALSKTAFVRDEQLKKQKGQEFSNFTSGELVQKGIDKKKYDVNGKPDPGFRFAPEGGIKGDAAAVEVTVKFSGYATAYFDYDAESGKYLKSEALTSKSNKLNYKEKQIDQNDGKQIAVDNVFILFADVHQYPGSSVLMDVNYQKGGSGYYISGGTRTDFTWSKPSYKSPFEFKKSDGSELQVNPGKSWVCIVSDNMIASTTMK